MGLYRQVQENYLWSREGDFFNLSAILPFSSPNLKQVPLSNRIRVRFRVRVRVRVRVEVGVRASVRVRG